MHKKYLFMLLMPFVASSCVVVPLVPPTNDRSAAVALTSGFPVLDPMLTFITPRQTADEFYMIKIDKADDALVGKPVVRSNAFRKERAYWLNAVPGDYVLVGIRVARRDAMGRTGNFGGVTNYYFLDEKAARSVRFTVKPGQLTIVGDVVMKPGEDLVTIKDPLAQFVANVVAPGTSGSSGLAKGIVTGEVSHPMYIDKHDTTPITLAKMKGEVAQDFGGTPWQALFK